MLRSEVWLHGWLKAQGYQVDLYTDVDLDGGIDHLADYRALIVSTHPEYWTRTMMGRVSEYLDAGRSLLYLGGNGIFRPTALRAEVAGGNVDLMTSESARWSSFSEYEGKPLLAARVDQPGNPGRGVGLTISDPDHRFVPTGAIVGEVVGTSGWNGLPDVRRQTQVPGLIAPVAEAHPWGASGWETDHWPPPLPDGVAELARDAASAAGAVIACYETASGGYVLGAGSLTFVGGLMEDVVLQQIVTNALAEALVNP